MTICYELRRLRLAAVALAIPAALSGCAGILGPWPTVTVTAPSTSATAARSNTATTSQRDALVAWHETTQAPIQELSDAMDQISTAAKADNLSAMGIACQRAHDATDQVQQHMPSPDPELTAALQKAISDYNGATRICTTAVENRNLDDFQQGADLINEGNNYVDTAVSILRRDLGLSPDTAAPQSASPSGVPTPLRAQNPLPDADTQGFLNYRGSARCGGNDPAALIMRTSKSAVVICQSGPGSFYYRGLRFSDGGNMELAGATPTSSGFSVTNPSGGTEYDVSQSGLVIHWNGEVYTESAIESSL
jgi:hypothetical protein